MSRLINFDNYSPVVEQYITKKNNSVSIPKEKCTSKEVSADQSYDEVISLLLRLHPNKLAYTQKDAAEILGLSYQYINKKCVDGEIRTVKFGNRQLININEMAKLLMEVLNNNVN